MLQNALIQLNTHLKEQLKPVLDSLVPPPVPRPAVTRQQYFTLECKTNLMYWLQAHYSSSLERRYRTLNPYAAALVMAHDLHTLDGEVPDAEVEAVLEEALFMVFREESETQKTLLEAVKAVVINPEIGRVLSNPGEFLGRETLLEVVSRCVHDGSTKLSSALLERHLGIPGKTLISPIAIGLWSLRVKAELAVLR